MNKDGKVNEIRSLIATKKVDVFGLNETKIKSGRQQEMIDKFGQDWEIHPNYDQMDSGEEDSIWCGWNSSIWTGSIGSKSKQHIHCRLINRGGLNICVTVIYGKNNKTERLDLWDKLREINRCDGNLVEPWLVFGDYNEIRMASERLGVGVYEEDGPNDFNQMISDTLLDKLPTTKGLYTWTKYEL